MLADQDVSAQLLLQHHTCLLAAMLPAMMSSLVMVWAIWSCDPPVTDWHLKRRLHLKSLAHKITHFKDQSEIY